LRFLRLCWRAPLILIVCAGILAREVEPISQAQPFLFSIEIARLSNPGAGVVGLFAKTKTRDELSLSTILDGLKRCEPNSPSK